MSELNEVSFGMSVGIINAQMRIAICHLNKTIRQADIKLSQAKYMYRQGIELIR